MEPERHIEKELKAFAEKRRAAAGASVELSPARRKALLEQAERLAKVGEAETRPWWQTIWSSWPRLAVTGGAVAALAAIIWILLPAPETQREHFQSSMELAGNNAADFKKDLSVAEKEEPMTRAASPNEASKLTPPALDGLNIKTMRPVNRPTASTPAPVDTFAAATPPPPATVEIAAPAVALPRESVLKDKDFTLSDAGGGETGGVHSNRSMLTLSPRPSSGDITDAQVATIVQSFQQMDLPPASGVAGVAASVSNVLVSFRVEQALGKLRMIDSDGSVYEGFVSQKSEAVKQPVMIHSKTMAEDRAGFATVSGSQAQAIPTRLYRFRVSGTNRTLNEEIVFTGDFLASGGAPAPQAAAPTNVALIGDIPSGAAGESLPLELRRARLEGRLLLGKTNNIEIRAAPVKN